MSVSVEELDTVVVVDETNIEVVSVGIQGPSGSAGITDHTQLTSIGVNTHAQIDTAISASASHISNTNNPHAVTKAQVGLANVDNTSDLAKPLSTAAQSALSLKARKIEYNIEDYGAVGDAYTSFTNYTYNVNATDNTVAIQAAFNAAALTGGTVVVPPNAYMTDQLTLPDHVSIRGANRKTSTLVLKKNSTNGHIIKSAGFGTAGAATGTDDPYAGISYFNITDISFDGNGGNQATGSGGSDYRDQFAIVKIYGWHYHFARVEMRQAKETGLYTEHASFWYDTFNYYQFGESSYDRVYIKNYNGAGWVNRGSHDSMATGVYLSSYVAAGYNAYAGYVQQGNGNYNAQGFIPYNLHVWGQHQTNAVYISGSNIVEGMIYAEGSTQAAVFLNNSSANKFHLFAGFATHAIELNGASNGNHITATVESTLSGSLARINTSASGNYIEQQGGYNSSGAAVFDLATGGTYTGTRNTFVPSRTFTGTLFNGTPSQLDNVGVSGGAQFLADDFGAAGDDATDDAIKINDSLLKLPEGGELRLGPRKYRINSPIYVPRNKTLTGTQGLRWRYAVTPGTYIKPRSTFAGLAAIIMQDKEQGGYATEQGGQRIRNLNVDMSAITTGTADGILASGLIRDVRIENVSVSYARGKGIRTISYTRADTSVNYPRGWQLSHVVADTGFDNGFNFNNLTDSYFDDCLAVGNAANGFSISGSGENLFTGCRAVFNKNNGFLVTGSNFGTSSFVNISTDRNEYNGMLINVAGTTTAKYPINITAPNFRRDGRNGNTGGGSYAGLTVTSAASPVIVDNIAVLQGVDDNGSGTSSPNYGVSATGSDVTVTSGHIWGSSSAVNNSGSNTNLIIGEHVQLATGAVGGTKTTIKSGGAATSGYVLTANGNGTSPTWQSIPTMTTPDATASSKGIIQLAGDLAGTASSPTVPGLATKEPAVTGTTSADYYRGDKTFQPLTKSAVGLSNVDNTSDTSKPVSTAQAASIATKEPVITLGTTGQYWRGDKTFQTLDKAAVGLGNVDNTSDVNKPVSTAQAAADAQNLPLAGGTMSGSLVTATPAATLAALRIPAGVVLTTPVSGVIENDGSALFYTNSSNARLSLVTRTGIETISNKTFQTPTLNGVKVAYSAKTAAYTTVNTDVSINAGASGGAFTVTLLTAVGNTGLVQVVRKSDSSANAVTIATTSSQTINGAATYVLSAQYKYVSVESDGANWMIVGNN